MRLLWGLLIGLGLVFGEIVEFAYDYDIGDGELYEGYVAYDDSLSDLPGVLIQHQFYGVSANEIYWAREWAAQGYFAFAGDVYTKFIRPTTREEASGNSTFMRTNAAMHRARVQGAMKALLDFDIVDNDKGLVACGYCFGVSSAFELARSLPGNELKAAIGFHGNRGDLLGIWGIGLNNRFPDIHIQYHNGVDDPGVSDQDLAEFERQLRVMDITTWSVHQYKPAVHGFAEPVADAYNELASTQAHFSMFMALQDVFPGTFTKKDIWYAQPEGPHYSIETGPWKRDM